ncbi:hypothetical protein [Nocardia stercoris]|uniref:hypothetical protein n=1 Tax=Nocardia stercoris TaxID=2483361 RepID=UPI0018F55C7D|nr:hypothetical protein [Nocardia stercoris]
MAFVTPTIRAAALRTAVSTSARRFWARHHLTAAERHNLRVAMSPVAVVTASLGGHSR